jgi:hydrogenase nickel incorporation protein HypA/HybF
MHEMSVAIALLDRVLDEAKKGGLQTVTRATVALGTLQSIEPDLLRDAFQAAAEGSLAQGAKLEIELQAAKARCLACGHTFEPSYRDYSCPACDKAEVKVESGRDMYLLSLSGDAADEALNEKPI